jgi:hypothetical protein
MTGTNCDLFTHKSSWSYLNHLVHERKSLPDHRDKCVKWNRCSAVGMVSRLLARQSKVRGDGLRTLASNSAGSMNICVVCRE